MKAELSSEQVIHQYHLRKTRDPRNFTIFVNSVFLLFEMFRLLKDPDLLAIVETATLLVSLALVLPSVFSDKYVYLIRFGFMLSQLRIVSYHYDLDGSRQDYNEPSRRSMDSFFLFFSLIGLFFHFYSFDAKQRGHQVFGAFLANLVIVGMYFEILTEEDTLEKYGLQIYIGLGSFQIGIFGLVRSQAMRRLYMDYMFKFIQNQQFLKVLLDSQTNGLLIVEDSGSISYSNPAFQKMLRVATKITQHTSSDRDVTAAVESQQGSPAASKFNCIKAMFEKVTSCRRQKESSPGDNPFDDLQFEAEGVKSFPKIKNLKIFELLVREGKHFEQSGSFLSFAELMERASDPESEGRLSIFQLGAESSHELGYSFSDRGQYMFVRVEFTSLVFREETRQMIKVVDVSKEVLYDKSKEKNELLTLINATVSHELRNPLNSIIAECSANESLLQKLKAELAQIGKQSLTPEASELLQQLEACQQNSSSSADLMSLLVADFLDHAQIRQGTFQTNCTRFNIVETIEQVMAIQKKKAESLNIQLAADFGNISLSPRQVPSWGSRTTFSPIIYTDRQRLMQVLVNLQSNALKFTQQGSVTISVRIVVGESYDSPAPPDRFLEVTITDTGVGVPYEEQDKLFKLFGFVQSTEQYNRSGIGLGLVITEQIVKKLGGSIRFTSVPYPEQGHGTKMTFTFKLEPSEEIESFSFQQAGARDETQKPGLNQFALFFDWVPSPREQAPEAAQASCNVSVLSDPRNGDSLCLRNQGPLAPGSFFTTHENLLPQELPRLELPNIEKPQVLVVDDQVFNIDALKAVLSCQAGLPPSRIDSAPNGKDALLKVITNFEDYGQPSYKLILMDCNMPFMDGYEATLEIRHFYSDQGISLREQPLIVAVTGHTEPQYVEKCFRVGMNQVLSKPVGISLLKYSCEAAGLLQ